MSVSSFFRRMARRLTGWPLVTISYRVHRRVLPVAHPLILKLIEDSADGEVMRTTLAEWYRGKRPIVDIMRGTCSTLRVDGPMVCVGHETFALGSLIHSPQGDVYLDPIDTLRLVARIREDVEAQIQGWIDAHKERFPLPCRPIIDREVNDPKAIAQITEWARTHDCASGVNREACCESDSLAAFPSALSEVSTKDEAVAPNFEFSCSPELARVVMPILERLTRDDADGAAYRLEAGNWHLFERPILKTYHGGRYLFQTEGPGHKVDHIDYALGSEIMGPLGWIRLDPIETLALVTDLRLAVDRVVGDWCARHPEAQGKRNPVERPEDDIAARVKLNDWLGKRSADGGTSNVH